MELQSWNYTRCISKWDRNWGGITLIPSHCISFEMQCIWSAMQLAVYPFWCKYTHSIPFHLIWSAMHLECNAFGVQCIWSVMQSAVYLFCHLPLKRDQRDWDKRLRYILTATPSRYMHIQAVWPHFAATPAKYLYIWQFPLTMLHPRNPPNREIRIPGHKFELNHNLNLNLYREIPRDLIISIWWLSGM